MQRNKKVLRPLVGLLVLGAVAVLAVYVLRLFWLHEHLNLKYDWGYPLFNWYYTRWGITNAWNDWFLGSAVTVNAGWLPSAIMVVFASVAKLSIMRFLALFITALFVTAATGMTAYLRDKQVRWWVAVACGVLYMLAPVMWIRVVVGFIYYLIAIALAPWLLWSWGRAVQGGSRVYWLVTAGVFAVIAAQPQFVVMVGILLVLDILVTADRSYRRNGWLLLLLSIGMLLVIQSPWISLLLRGGTGSVASGNALGGSLGTISSVPHSALRTLFGADHNITYLLVEQLLKDRWYALASLGLVMLAVFAPLFRRRSRTVAVMTIALVIGWVMGLGPQIPTGPVFVWIYSHMPLQNIFREVYHWSWLITFALITLAALSLDTIARRLKGGVALIIVAVLLAGWALPWMRGDFYAYISPLTLPDGYQQIAISPSAALQQKGRSLFLPSLGFLIFRNDVTPGAVNSDVYAFSTNRSQLPYASSLLDLPNPGQEIRNAAVMALRTPDAGSFTGYLQATAVDTVFDRPTIRTKFTELFTLPTHRRQLTADWQDLRYAPLLQHQNGIYQKHQYTGVTEYAVQSPTTLFGYASSAVLAGDDWRILSQNATRAVFFANDHVNLDQGLPYIGDTTDLLAARLSEYNLIASDLGGETVPQDGWVRKSAVWWWDPALTTIKGPYVFTTATKPLTLAAPVSTEPQTVYVKYWGSSWAKQLQITVAKTAWKIDTVTVSNGEWHWQRVGELPQITATDRKIVVSGEGETGVAQLLIAPTKAVQAAAASVVAATKVVEEGRVFAADSPITFEKKQPSRYLLNLTNDHEQTLIARIGYDSGWRLHTSLGDFSPVITDGYAMAFQVPPLHEQAVLEFMPQRAYKGWMVVASIVFLTTVCSAIYLALASKQRPRKA